MTFKKIAALALALAACPLFAATSSASPPGERAPDALQTNPCTQGCQQAGWQCRRHCSGDTECLSACAELQADCINSCLP
jgi:hypothetical protein